MLSLLDTFSKSTFPWRLLLKIVLIGFLLRVAGMVLFHTYSAKLEFDESGHIAAALATGRGFSDPFGAPTGPTAWLAPAWPYLLSRYFVLFGAYSRAAIVAALLLNCAFSAVTCIPIYFSALYSFGERTARQSAWVWALFPYTMYWGFRSIWDTALSALLLTLLFMMTLQLAEGRGTWAIFAWPIFAWPIYGFLWGIAGLTNTAQLAFLPFAGIWICWRRHRQERTFLRDATVGAILFFATIGPWLVRDYRTFHKFVPIRGNFGVEFHLGNSPTAQGDWQFYLHPSQNFEEFNRYREMGEPAYVKSKLRQALQFVHDEPARFAYLSFARFFYFWTEPPHAEKYRGIYEAKTFLFLCATVSAFWGLGIAMRQRLPGATLYLLLFLSYPTVYYITFILTRYRSPIEPEMLMLIVFLISQLRDWDARHNRNATADRL
jgi:4-amino-4-deoxy-L-arabinose transferase-like glycosyltransferase